ncbi:sensor histidine kinase [Streptomyces sp. OfavH-34-F]|uniref:sensor histidine kinase n=1 Tax=Streptomyces sp. OfavH-34-F TaxID=2917760 RepID=UPI0023B7D7EA
MECPRRSTGVHQGRNEEYEVAQGQGSGPSGHPAPPDRDDRAGRRTRDSAAARRGTRLGDDTGTRSLALLMHAAFFLLLGASLARFLLRHPGEDRTPWIIGLSLALAALYVIGPVLGSRPTPRSLVWLGALVAVWMVLVVLAPSFAWCAVPLFYTGLRILPPRAAYALVALLTLFVVAAQLRLAHGFDPNLVLAPPAVAAVATAVFVHMRRQAVRQERLIDDLLRTRRELAATERREGTLAERQRLSMEIHDTLAQGLSSQQMLLQAADRTWDTDPDTARRHIRTAAGIAERNLAEARRFVHDLAPADLAEGGGLEAALRALAARETAQAQGGLTVRCHIEGAPPAVLPDRTQSALLRIAQGALANVTEHSGATEAALTLTHLDDRTVLDIADNGHGFTPAPGPAAPTGVRGHGLPAMRARLRQLGGTLTIESAPGEGTVVTATVPTPPAATAAPTPQDPA